jgi:signal peptidase II
MQQRRLKIVLLTILANVLVDQITKIWAIDALRGMPTYRYLGDIFRLQYAENPGAFLSLGSSLSPTLRFLVLTLVVGVFLVGALLYVVRTPALSTARIFGLALLIGGGVSNLIDRAFREGGRVIDFLNLGIGDLRTGIFNIADVAIMAGIALVFFARATPGADAEPAKSGASR